jgi:Protein of unknown function (DUF559)
VESGGKSPRIGDHPGVLMRSFGLHGVFIGSHAVADGVLSVRQLREGPYVRVVHGVYADPSIPRDHSLRCRAVALLLPTGAALGGRSAAAILEAPTPAYGDPVTVVLPSPLKWRGPKGVRVHRTDLAAQEVQRVGVHELPVTSPLRTAWDVAVLESMPTAVGVLDAMARAGLVTVPDLRRLVERSAGRWGVLRARAAVEQVDPRSESPPESWVRVACAQAGLPAPQPQYVVVEGGEFLGKVDLAWPQERVIVEYEGPHHFDAEKIAKDDARYARLAAAGWTVIRLAAADLRDLADVVGRVAEALGLRRPWS